MYKYISIILGILLLAGGIYIFSQNQKKTTINQAQNEVSPTATQSVEPETTNQEPTENPVANNDTSIQLTETYTHPTESYSFKYAKDTKIVSAPPEIKVIKSGPDQRQQTEMANGILINFIVRSLDEKTHKDLKAAAESAVENASQNGTVTKPLTEITINGKTGYTYSAHGLGPGTFIFLPFGTEKYVSIANFTADPQGLGYEKEALAIINSLTY